VEPLITSSGATNWISAGLAGSAIFSRRSRAVLAPSSFCEIRIVVSGGENRSVYGMSLNPTTETSSGHDRPLARIASIAPKARRSLAARTALVSGRSYLSSSEPVLTIGLGDAPVVDRLEIEWPSGTRQTLEGVAVNQELDLVEPAAATP